MNSSSSFLPFRIPTNVVIVVDNASGHGLAAIEEERRRREEEDNRMRQYLATMAVSDSATTSDESDCWESDFDSLASSDADESTIDEEDCFVFTYPATCRWNNLTATKTQQQKGSSSSLSSLSSSSSSSPSSCMNPSFRSSSSTARVGAVNNPNTNKNNNNHLASLCMIPRCPVRRKSENSGELDLSENQKQSLLNIYNRSTTKKGQKQPTTTKPPSAAAVARRGHHPSLGGGGAAKERRQGRFCLDS